MASLRDHVGRPCPRCSNDILQAAESHNRMPGEEALCCHSCKLRIGVDDLARKSRGNWLRRLFGGRPSA